MCCSFSRLFTSHSPVLLACWYNVIRTFAHLAGADPTDHAAAAAGLPPVDSINLWPYLSGESATSPRKRIPIGSTTCVGGFTEGCINEWGWGNVKTIVQGLIEDRGSEGIWKIMTGANPMNGWQGPLCKYYCRHGEAARNFHAASVIAAKPRFDRAGGVACRSQRNH